MKQDNNEDVRNDESRISFQNDGQQYFQTESCGIACLDFEVNLKIDHIKDEDNVEATLKLFNLIDRHERSSQHNIKSPLEVNLMIESEPTTIFVTQLE